MSSTRTRIAAAASPPPPASAALAAAPAQAATRRQPRARRAGIATLKSAGLLSAVAKNGITVGTAVSVGVDAARRPARGRSPSTRSSPSRRCSPTTAPVPTASSSTPGAADLAQCSSCTAVAAARDLRHASAHRHGRPGPRWWSRPPLRVTAARRAGGVGRRRT